MREAAQSPQLMKLLAHDLRWQMLTALTWGDFRVQELVTLLNEPMNLVSYHLKKLREDGVVSTRRSEADGRDIYYSLNMPRLQQRFLAAGAALHPALAPQPPVVPVVTEPRRVLFICTHNAARSQMAEGLLRAQAGQQFEVFSAGSEPSELHPDAITTMDVFGIDIRQQQAKAITQFTDQSFDYVITVCDRAREICPTFPGDGEPLHWGFADPLMITDTADRRQAFQHIAEQLAARIAYFLVSLAHA